MDRGSRIDAALARAIILGTVNDKALIIGFISEDANTIHGYFRDANGVHGTIVIAKRSPPPL
jgi:hypothetical protein